MKEICYFIDTFAHWLFKKLLLNFLFFYSLPTQHLIILVYFNDKMFYPHGFLGFEQNGEVDKEDDDDDNDNIFGQLAKL